MINHITIEGRLAKDPELRRTQSGIEVTSGSIAFQKANDEADFFDIVAWRDCAQVLAKYRKGTRILIDGRLTTRSWVDKTGKKRTAVEIVADTIREIAGRRAEEETAPVNSVLAQPLPMADFAIPDEIPY